MLKNIQIGMNIFIIVLFAIAFITGIVMIIINIINTPKEFAFETEKMVTYLKEENLVKDDYATFYSIEYSIQNMIEALHNNKIDDMYSCLTQNAKNILSEDKSKLINYYEKNFKYTVEEGLAVSGYTNMDNLKKLYKIADNSYICVVSSINEAKQTKIGITIVDNKQYAISYLEW